jgi:molecular chaperone GrpE (heat shock protein)
LFAEFENYKRRTTKSVLNCLKQQTKSFISMLALDDFDRTIIEIAKSNETVTKGLN